MVVIGNWRLVAGSYCQKPVTNHESQFNYLVMVKYPCVHSWLFTSN